MPRAQLVFLFAVMQHQSTKALYHGPNFAVNDYLTAHLHNGEKWNCFSFLSHAASVPRFA